MDGNPLHRGRKGRKAKTGCRTCKIRRVKCDEERPACRRCVTTGRTCDGYGIWGSDHSRPHVQTKSSNHPAQSLVSTPVNTASDYERAGFEWFLTRTCPKMPGVFESRFWESVVLQASWGEPAVLQAVLALSAAHRREILGTGGPDPWLGRPDEQERIVLQHYSNAISLLQPHLSIKSKENLRVAIISCIVFTCLEFLRQQYKTGHALLQRGLELLSAIQPRYSENSGDAIRLKPQPESIDDCLIEEMARLDVQAALLGYGSRQVYVVASDPSSGTKTQVFQSVRIARQQLDALLNAIDHLRRRTVASEWVRTRQRIHAGLLSWLIAYEASLLSFEARMGPREILAYRLLRIYHTTASIMVATSLDFTDESIFDLHTPDFAALISQCTDLMGIASPTAISDTFAGTCTKRSSFIADMGLIAPLYYVALKCRVPRIRIQAIRLLLSVKWHEGIWNGRLAARVATEVMKIEHGEASEDFNPSDSLSICGTPEGHDSASPTVPSLSRVNEVHIKLANGSLESLRLICRRKQKDGNWEVLERVCQAN